MGNLVQQDHLEIRVRQDQLDRREILDKRALRANKVSLVTLALLVLLELMVVPDSREILEVRVSKGTQDLLDRQVPLDHKAFRDHKAQLAHLDHQDHLEIRVVLVSKVRLVLRVHLVRLAPRAVQDQLAPRVQQVPSGAKAIQEPLELLVLKVHWAQLGSSVLLDRLVQLVFLVIQVSKDSKVHQVLMVFVAPLVILEQQDLLEYLVSMVQRDPQASPVHPAQLVILVRKVHPGRRDNEVLQEVRDLLAIQVQLVRLGSKVSEAHWEALVHLGILDLQVQQAELDGLGHRDSLDLLEMMEIRVL